MRFFETAASKSLPPPEQSEQTARRADVPTERPPDADRAHDQDLSAARSSYAKAILLMKRVIDKRQDPRELYGEVRQTVQDLLKLASDDNRSLLLLSACSTKSDYLVAHSVNVCILALHLGLRIYWLHAEKNPNKEDLDQLLLLGVAAMLQDVARLKKTKFSAQPRTQQEQEAEAKLFHPFGGQHLVSHVVEVEAATRTVLLEVLGQAHGGSNAAARPKKLSDARGLPIASQIIGVCDIYEALTHLHSWRRPLPPHEVILGLTREHRQKFDGRIFKCLLETLSVYPPGSFVVLSNGDLARSIGSHPQLLTRPILEIWKRKGGKREMPAAFLDLAATPLIHVMKATDETTYWTEDQALLGDMAATHWWQETA